MRLHHFHAAEGNFGDDMNAWFWDAVLPGWRDWPADATLMGIGTVLTAENLPAGRRLVVGSGTGYGTPPDLAPAADWDIRAVRGPRTAARLGLDPALGLGDPAILLPRLAQFADIPRGNDTVFVPHYKTVALCDWPALCAGLGIVYQSPSDPAETVIRRLAGAGQVIAESMHAAIVADAFGTPWRVVRIARAFNDFKWGDWAESLGAAPLDIYRFFPLLRRAQDAYLALRRAGRPRGPAPAPANAPTNTPAAGGASGAAPARAEKDLLARSGLLDLSARRHLRRAAQGPFVLSDRDRLSAAQAALQAALDRVRRDYGPG